MGSKGLKAIVTKGVERRIGIARPEAFQDLVRYYRRLEPIPVSVSIYRYSTDSVPSLAHRMKRDPCYGCLGCFRRVYEAENGQRGKYTCHAAMFYQPWAIQHYGKWNEVPFYAARLVDNYGLDSMPIDLTIHWLHRCYEAGLLSDRSTGIPISRIGSLEFIETLVRMISRREGFGDVLAMGLDKAADHVGSEAKDQIQESGYLSSAEFQEFYDPRLYVTNAFFYAMEPRRPIQHLHEVGGPMCKWESWAKRTEGALETSDVVRKIAARFWGSEQAADFSTYEGKALAAKRIQDRQYAKECLILCDYLWPIIDIANSDDHVGDPSLESKILSAVTGNDVDEDELYTIGERVFNLQRSILVREGHCGRESDNLPDHFFSRPLKYDRTNPDCLVPGKDGEVVSRKGAVIDRWEFEKMKDEYYELRGWDVATGLQRRTTLDALELGDVAQVLERTELIAPSN